jgi:diacylglycerol O-acyltransferase
LVAERLSSLDLSFLCLEGTNTPMHLGAVLVFGRPEEPAPTDTAIGTAERIAAVLRHRAAAVPRLRRKLTPVAFPPGAAAWVDDPAFDPVDHVHTSTLPAPHGPDELATRTAELLASPLDRSRPMWEIHVIGALANGGIALLVKIHHALADGLRAVMLGMSLFDTPSQPTRDHERRATDRVPTVGLLHDLIGASNDALTLAGRLLDPRTTRSEVSKRARQVRDATAIGTSVTRHLLWSAAPRSPINVPVGRERRFAMLRIGLDDIHTVRKTHGGTVNDVLLTVVAGGLRRWLTDRGDLVRGPLRALVPVSRPHPDPHDTAGNLLSGYLVDLPIDEPDPLTRLAAVRTAMAANKAAGPARGPGAFPALANLLPPLLHRLAGPVAAPASSMLFNTVITQVPLPELNLTLAGARLTEIYPVVPLAAGQALGVAVSTFRGTAHVGLHADYDALPDLDQLGSQLKGAVAELMDARTV